MGLSHWRKRAAENFDKVAPFIRRGAKWFTVNVLAPVAYGAWVIAVEIVAKTIAGGRLSWELVLEPLMEEVSNLIRWALKEIAAALRWLWEQVTPWNRAKNSH